MAAEIWRQLKKNLDSETREVNNLLQYLTEMSLGSVHNLASRLNLSNDQRNKAKHDYCDTHQ